LADDGGNAFGSGAAGALVVDPLQTAMPVAGRANAIPSKPTITVHVTGQAVKP
jgi:hypothetical protein